MTLYLQSVCQLGFLALCCVLITVRESDSTFVPRRCLCPETKPGVKGQLKDLSVFPKSPSCDKITVIVTMKRNVQVCLSPDTPMGKQLIRCWNRAQKLGRSVKVCLKRRRRRGQRQQSQPIIRRDKRRPSSSNSQ